MLQVKRSGSLVFFFRDGELHSHNLVTGREWTSGPMLVPVLARLGRWQSQAQLLQSFSEYSPASVRRTLRQLAAHTLVVRRGSAQARREAALSLWDCWGLEAQWFHFSTKGAHRLPPVQDELRFSRALLQESPEPPQIKRYPRARCYSLPDSRPPLPSEFPSVLLARRTHRRFGRGKIRLEELSALLGLTWGITGRLRWPGLPPRPLKTSPSGGARHSLEVYVWCLRVAGLPAGTYHYRPDRHRLELLRRGVDRNRLVRFCGHQGWVREASALFVMTSVFPRVMWRYHFARAYRTVLLEAGHFGQTFCLAATWLGLAPFSTAALDDVAIEEHLGLDGVSESVLYAVGVGAQPEAP